jgi:hypothetical protein
MLATPRIVDGQIQADRLDQAASRSALWSVVMLVCLSRRRHDIKLWNLV